MIMPERSPRSLPQKTERAIQVTYPSASFKSLTKHFSSSSTLPLPNVPIFLSFSFPHRKATRKRPEVTTSRPIPRLHLLKSNPTGESRQPCLRLPPMGAPRMVLQTYTTIPKLPSLLVSSGGMNSEVLQTDSIVAHWAIDRSCSEDQ